jgi:hypothetical protein
MKTIGQKYQYQVLHSTKNALIVAAVSTIIVAELCGVTRMLETFNLQTDAKDYKALRADGSSAEVSETTRGLMQHYLTEKSFCFDWSHSDALNRTMQPFDEWWTHNPRWFVENETDAEFCMKEGDLQNDGVKQFLMFYATQFYSSCKKVNWR